jgi:drug/metabolite transporter (DMT)-like permease
MWALGATATKNVKTRTGILSRVDRETFVLVVVGGTIDATANAIYLLSVQRGQLAVVGAIVALYPAVTVLLARILHGERPGNLQGAGLVLAAGALLVVGASS